MYGQNAGVLRESLRELLTFHRIQHRIGGAGPRHVPATTTAEERELIGAQIARYRHSVLTWCHQGLYAANPHIDHQTLTRRTRGPVDELRHRLGIALGSDHAGLPTLEELTTTHPFLLVELWRHAARACALGEHDFTAGAGYGRLSKAQALTLVHDIAEVTEALLALDRRYDSVPGWQHLTNPTRLAPRGAGLRELLPLQRPLLLHRPPWLGPARPARRRASAARSRRCAAGPAQPPDPPAQHPQRPQPARGPRLPTPPVA
ncbi:hypothetical protein GCM10023153_12990 [Ornithinibacter aureus]|uniref:Uncharacterized protein n=1 Tax=Ornithinibacter aureus TaxID=622664 RepID=A0ABP8JMN7_9MICO